MSRAVVVSTVEGLLAQEGARSLLYYPDGSEIMPALVTLAAELGGTLYGSPSRPKGASIPGFGRVLPLGSVANSVPADIDELLAELRRESGPRTRTAGSAAVRSLERCEGDGAIDAYRSGYVCIPPNIKAMHDGSVFGGPVEWRAAVKGCPLTYLDQASAFLRAMERGVPDGRWFTPPGRDAQRYVATQGAREGWCVVSDVTLHLSEPVVPVRTAKGVIHPVGRVRATVRGPHLLAALATGAGVEEWHDTAICRRVRWHRWTAHMRSMMDEGGARRAAAKAMYQRLWGKLVARDGWTATPSSRERKCTVSSAELGACGWTVYDWSPTPRGRWTARVDRPDIAGEITAQAGAETLYQAAKLERDGHPVALLHVDAVMVVGSPRKDAAGPAWSVKARGKGDVYGPGRYIVQGKGGSWVAGRMGMREGEAFTPSDDTVARGVRVWAGDPRGLWPPLGDGPDTGVVTSRAVEFGSAVEQYEWMNPSPNPTR